jgi:signal transduction histidine kinase/DNA-binding response OmpR family regulator
MKSTFGASLKGRAATIAVILLIVSLLATAAVSAAVFKRKSTEHLQLLQHSYAVVQALMATEVGLGEIELHRNAVLSGVSSPADVAALINIGTSGLVVGTRALKTLTQDDASQHERAEVVARRTDGLVADVQRALGSPEAVDHGAAAAIQSARRQSAALTAELYTMIQAERRVLADRTTAYLGTTGTIGSLFLTALAATGLLAAFAIWQFRRNSLMGQARIRELEVTRAELRTYNAALNVTRRRLQSIMDHADDAIFLIDARGIVSLANAAAARLFGLSAEAMVGHLATDRITSLSEEAKEVFGIRGDGSRFPGDISIGGGAGEHADETVCILRDATERYRLSQLKNEFVATVSHELRTPLTSIRGSLGLVIAGAAGELPPKVRQFVEIAHNNSARLVYLVNDILDIEKIDSGRMEFRRDAVQAHTIVDQAIETNQAYGAQRGITFHARIDVAADVTVTADAVRIQQVMANLLSNAAKFSPSGGQVEVAITADDMLVHISVLDQGAGVPSDFHGRIFQRFAQADSSDRRQKGGTGLGLSICKAIVEYHGGTIGFDLPEAGGSRFWFTLPRRREEPAIDPATMSPAAAKKILVVEDDPDVANLLRLMLEQHGWAVTMTYSSRAAEAELAMSGYDLMTLDIRLPDEDGLSLFRRLRASEATRRLPVIIVSAVANETRTALAGDAFAVIDWLDKPIDERRLRDAVRDALQIGPRGPAETPLILHVEDDADVLRVLQAVVGNDVEVVPASSVAAGRRELAERSFSLVILDVSLPDGSGLDIVDQIRRLDDPPPILIFSARDYDAKIAARVTTFLVKSRTDNRALHDVIYGLVENGNARKATHAPVEV